MKQLKKAAVILLSPIIIQMSYSNGDPVTITKARLNNNPLSQAQTKCNEGEVNNLYIEILPEFTSYQPIEKVTLENVIRDLQILTGIREDKKK